MSSKTGHSNHKRKQQHEPEIDSRIAFMFAYLEAQSEALQQKDNGILDVCGFTIPMLHGTGSFDTDVVVSSLQDHVTDGMSHYASNKY